jgi:undecaprenyl-diphosphatase
VGISRVTLGVHWATDVIGGWAFGAAWAVLWLQVARVVAQR